MKACGGCPKQHRLRNRFKLQGDINHSLVTLDRNLHGLALRAEQSPDGLQIRWLDLFAVDAANPVVCQDARSSGPAVVIDRMSHDPAVLSEEMKTAQVTELRLIESLALGQ